MWTWRIRKHHGWQLLHSDYCDTRAEFDASCDRLARDTASTSSDSPSLFSNREEYDECAYYVPAWPADAAAAVAYGRTDVSFYSTHADAEAVVDKATIQHGYDILLADMGNHAGPCNVVEASDITIRLAGEPVSFDAATPDHVFTEEEVSDALGEGYDYPQIAAALNAHLQTYREP